MAHVLVCEPVAETRILIERVVQRMGHRIVADDSLADVDVVVYEPGSRAGLALARRARSEHPAVRLVACCSEPGPPGASGPTPFATLVQPFSPADLRRVLLATLPPVAQPA